MTLCDHCHEPTIHPELTLALMYEKKHTPFTKPRVMTLCGQCLMEFHNKLQALINDFKVKIPPKATEDPIVDELKKRTKPAQSQIYS